MALTVEEFKRYLKFDLWNLDQFMDLIEDRRPVLNRLDVLDYYTFNSDPNYQLAVASIRAGKIKGNGEKEESKFAASPKAWIDWANSKSIELPKALKTAYATYEPEEEQSPRTQESYRPPEEFYDKIAIVAVMKVIHQIFPELPLKKLVTLAPVKNLAQSCYKEDTLISWANENGLTTKVGRPAEEDKKKYRERIPKEWGLSWN